ncbi:MAG: Ig-like domain repeat protein [Methanobacterium sp. ERen5]|nr:MAG: Ig-like domain repeat protein [Methanobacterium sp. ERen5]
MNSASAASGDHIYVNGSSGNDANSGLTPQTAKLTIKNATATVNTGGIVSISNGTYNGIGNTNIEINHDMTIIGAGKTKTIINGSNISRIFLIDNNINFVLKNLTITNGKSEYGAGIYNHGKTTVENCVFSNSTTIWGFLGGGSAIASDGSSTLNISNTDFLNNDASLSTDCGGTIYTNGTLNMNNCSFIGNIGYFGGCIFTFKGAENITNCSFINNTAQNKGGILCQAEDPFADPISQRGNSNVNFRFCSFVGNLAYSGSIGVGGYIPFNNMYNEIDNYLNMTSCWWGSNKGPDGIGGMYIADNWICMVLNATNVKYGKTTTVTADFNNLYDPSTKLVSAIDPSINHIPDGLVVDFSTDKGQITTPSIVENGTASVVYTGTELGTANIGAKSCNQTLASMIDVLPLKTTTTVDNVQNYPGEKIKLTAHVKDEDGNPADGGYVTFIVNDSQIKVQVANGIATTTWTIPSSWNAGIYTINAIYDGTGTIYGNSSASGRLFVMLIPTQISSGDVTGEVGDKVAIKAHLQDKYGNPLEGQKVYFNINNSNLSGTTNGNGDVTVYYTITGNSGSYNIIITYGGTNQYEPSPYISKLTVNKITTSITVPDVTGKHGENVNLQAVLKDKYGKPISGQTVSFLVNGDNVGTGKTDDDGTAVFSYNISNGDGIYEIRAEYGGSEMYAPNMNIGKLTVNPIKTEITVNNVNAKHGDKTSITATLKDENQNPIKGQTVTFQISGQTIGTAITDSTGTATIEYIVQQIFGTYIINANTQADNIYTAATGKATLTVNPIKTELRLQDIEGNHGYTANIKARLVDENFNPLAWKTLTFQISGQTIGTAITDDTGTATLNYIITQTVGSYLLTANYDGDNIYAASTSKATLTVNPIEAKLTVNDVTAKHGYSSSVKATLTDDSGNSISGKTVSFYLNGNIIGTTTTDTTGTATLNYIVNQKIGSYTITANTDADNIYTAATGKATLTVNPISTETHIKEVKGKHGEFVNLIATLKDVNGDPIAGKTITFNVLGGSVGTATTDNTGTATLSYNVTQYIGGTTILVDFDGDDFYSSSSDHGVLVIEPINTDMEVQNVNGKHGNIVNLKATLRDEYGNLLTGKTITFKINDQIIGTATTDATGTATLSYTITQGIGNWDLAVLFDQDKIYGYSGDQGTLKVSEFNTQLTVNNASIKNGDKTVLKAVLIDENGNLLTGKTIYFSINNQSVGTAVTDNTGTATLNYTANNSGNFIVNANFIGDNEYFGSHGIGNLNVTSWAGLYIKTTVINTHPKVGETFTINYKLGNNGPDTANNVVVSFKIPAGLEFITGNSDSGNWTFDPVTRTLTWTLNNVVVGDPNLKITLKALENGNYNIIPTITSNTTTNVTQNSAPIIEVLKNTNSNGTGNNHNNTNETVNNTNHNTKLPNTGLPIAPLIVGLLMVIGGIAVKK